MLSPSHTDCLVITDWTNTSFASTIILLALEDEKVNKSDKGLILMMTKPRENKNPTIKQSLRNLEKNSTGTINANTTEHNLFRGCKDSFSQTSTSAITCCSHYFLIPSRNMLEMNLVVTIANINS